MTTDAGKPKPPEARRGDPFKMTTVALLVVTVVMALVFGTQSMHRRVEDRDKRTAARSEVEAVQLLLEQGDLPNAVVALHDIGMRLGTVEGSEDAALKVSDAVKALVSEGEATRRQLATAREEIERRNRQLADTAERLERRETQAMEAAATRDRNALILDNLGKGRVDLALRLVGGSADDDTVAAAAGRIADRIATLNATAELPDGPERDNALRTLARAWGLPGLERVVGSATDARASRERALAAVAMAEDAIGRGDPAGARASLVKAFEAVGIGTAGGLLPTLATLQIRVGAQRAEKEGNLVTALAGYRVVGDEKDVERLDRKVHAARLGEDLRALAGEFVQRRDYIGASALMEAAHNVTTDPALKREADKFRGSGILLQAKEFRLQGKLVTALELVKSAAVYEPVGGEAAELTAAIQEEMKEFRRNEALAQADQALASGAPDLAAKLIEGKDVPEALAAKIEAARKESALVRARAALHEGDGKAALALLERAGVSGPLAAEADLMAGDIARGVAALPEGAEIRTARLLACAWTVVGRDPARAARLGLAAHDLTGARPGTVGLLTAALAAAGDVPEGDELWDRVRAVIFEATELPGEK